MGRHAGIDILIFGRDQGRGHATAAARTLARYLIDERGYHRLAVDPAADNAAAIRTYEKVGFRAVGVMREYWRSPEGTGGTACSWTCSRASSTVREHTMLRTRNRMCKVVGLYEGLRQSDEGRLV